MQPNLFQPERRPDFTLEDGRKFYVDPSQFGQIFINITDANQQPLGDIHLAVTYPDDPLPVTEEIFIPTINLIDSLYALEDNFVLHGHCFGVVFFSIEGAQLQIPRENTDLQMIQLDTGNIAILNMETNRVTVHDITTRQELNSFQTVRLAEDLRIFPLVEGNFAVRGESTDIAIYSEEGVLLSTIPNTLRTSQLTLCTYEHNPETSFLAYFKKEFEPETPWIKCAIDIWDIQNPLNPQMKQALPRIFSFNSRDETQEIDSLCKHFLLIALKNNGYQPKPITLITPIANAGYILK